MFKQFLILVIFIIVAGCSAAPSDSFYIPTAEAQSHYMQEYDGLYPDANKSWKGDRKMCWAAVAANMLEYAGYIASSEDTYNIFKDVFENKVGQVGVGIEAIADRSDYFYYGISYMLMDAIVEQLHLNNAVGVYLESRLSAHVVTLYGYTYVSDTEYTLHFVDSDDQRYIVHNVNFEFNPDTDYWHAIYSKTNIKMTDIVVLKREEVEK